MSVLGAIDDGGKGVFFGEPDVEGTRDPCHVVLTVDTPV